MPYGTIKVDTITFTDAGVDKSISVSGLVENPTFTGNVTATGTISGDIIRGGTLVSGATVTGTTANFVSGVFTTQVSGATVTGNTGRFTSGIFTSFSGTTATITSGVFASGTAAAPSVSIGTSTNGLYSSGSNEVAISTNGQGRLFVNSSGQVGIGASSPANLLNLTGDNTAFRGQLSIQTSSAGNFSQITFYDRTTLSAQIYQGYGTSNELVIQNVLNGPLWLATNNQERLRITSGGLVGIGTASPNVRLEVSSTDTTVCRLATSDTGSSNVLAINNNDNFNYGTIGVASANGTSTGDVFSLGYVASLGATATNVLNWTSQGRVGIGTTSPVSAFKATFSGDYGIRIQNQDANQSFINFGVDPGNGYAFLDTDKSGTGTALPMRFAVNAQERMRIDTSGRLLVNTSNARNNFYNGVNTNQFQIEGTTYQNSGAAFTANSTATDNSPVISLNKSAGSSIGSNTLTGSGHIIGTVTFQGNDGTEFIEAAKIDAVVDGTSGADSMPGRLTFYTNSGTANTNPIERMRIDSTGLVTLAGPGIKFPATQVASTDANVLDDYEEGIWTCVLTLKGGTGNNQTFNPINSNYTSRYTKIGKRVCVDTYVRWNLSAIATNGWTFTAVELSLPFVAGNRNGEQYSPVSIGYLSNFYTGFPTTNNTIAAGYLATGGSSFNLTHNNPNGTESLITNAILSTNASAGIMFQFSYEASA